MAPGRLEGKRCFCNNAGMARWIIFCVDWFEMKSKIAA